MTIDGYLDESTLPYPFCPGCGHGTVLDSLNKALDKLQVDPHKLVIVTDIGCSGLSDKFFTTNALHGLHGRALTYATGIKLVEPELEVIVLIGDGGCGIGGNHLIHAARRNIGITVLVFNNLNYGMTGGQHSVTTLPEASTATSWYGHLEQPMDICATVNVNGAGFSARATTFDSDLSDLITQAIEHDGFALLDVWELCTAHYVPNNRFSKKLLLEAIQKNNFSVGILQDRPRAEYSTAYCDRVKGEGGISDSRPKLLEQKYTHSLSGSMRFVISGTAGMRIVSTSALFCQGAILSGLWATQRSDYPVTVRSGYSTSEVILSDEPIHFTGISKPDLMVVLSQEGLDKTRPQVEVLEKKDVLYIHSDLLPVETEARVVPLKFGHKAKKNAWSLLVMAEVLGSGQIYPKDALREAIELEGKFNHNLLDRMGFTE